MDRAWREKPEDIFGFAFTCDAGYRKGMGDVNKLDFQDDSAPILDEEDEFTLAAIDRAVKAAAEGRVVPLEEVRRRMERWATRSSSPKTR